MSPRISTLYCLAIFLFTLAWPSCLQAADDTPVTVVKKAPIVALSAQGSIMSVTEATVGSRFTFLSLDGSLLTMQDAQGNHYRINLDATDYVVPATPPPAAPTPPSASVAPASETLSSSHSTNAPDIVPIAPAPPPPTTAVDATAASGAPSDAVASINQGLGRPFFSNAPLWGESALLVASRLKLGLEDRTKWEASYRRYFYDQTGHYAPQSILGGAAYCVALYADANDNPTSLLIAFTNDGDYAEVGPEASVVYKAQDSESDEGHRKSFEPLRAHEQELIAQNLTTLFGEPRNVSFGSDRVTREDSQRWDWNGVSFLLTGEKEHYNLLRIIPTALADANGRTERIPRDEIGVKLSAAVEHRPNGDVVITQLPMADQGQKGYCVPATWERVLRYTGVPGDMYTLSRIGGAGFGGGEDGEAIASQLDETLHDYGRHAEVIQMSKIDSVALHRYIDEGIPVFWGVNTAGYVPVEQRYALCDRDKDWDQWKALLDQSRADKSQASPLVDYTGHQVLITGYNADTHEIAWSDPWGRKTSERWMTEEEAQRCSLGQFYIITW